MQEIPQDNPLQFQKISQPETDMTQIQMMESEISEIEMYDMPMSEDMSSSRSSMNMRSVNYEQDIDGIC